MRVTRSGATSPGSTSSTGRARILGLAFVVLSGVVAVPAVGWLGSSGAAQAAAPASRASTTASCTRILEGTEWYFDPCIPEGEPLPQDVLDALEEIRRERACQTPTSTPTSTSTWSPPPSTTTPTSTSTWSPPPTSSTHTSYPSGRAAAVESVTATDTAPPTTTPPSFPPPTTTPPSGPPTTTPPTGPPTTTPPTTTPPSCPPTTEPPTSPPTTPPTSPPPTEPTEPVEPLPPPSCPSGDLQGASALGDLEDARSDRIECRDPATIPDRANPVVLVATGDSLTSAHHQFGFGAMCENTSADGRNLKGNNAIFSYAGRYFTNHNPNVIEYYNFARTGFSTGDMLGANAGTGDACGNAWGRAGSPVALADAVVRKAKADGRKAYFVTTGGVNNTNWTTVLSRLIECRAMEFMQNIIPRSSLAWNAVGGKAGIVTNGGGCTLRVRNLAIFGMDYFRRVGVPRYDGPIQVPGITADVTRVLNTMIAAGADKMVWMLYYDINPANVDIANFGLKNARANSPQWVVDLLPVQINANNQPLVDPLWVGAVRNLVNALNAAIVAGVPNNARVRAQPAPGFVAADIQNTAIGGSPHPSVAGQTKLSNTLNAAFRAL